MTPHFVLVTAAMNEDAFIGRTIEAVVSQTVVPARWVIVSDGSTDRTDEIVAAYARQHGFITLLRLEKDGRRSFGAQVRAINTATALLKGTDYEFVGNIDADVSFDRTYFETLLRRFASNTRLGLGGGWICEMANGAFEPRVFNRATSVAHAVQLFRRRCFEEIGGYIPFKYGGPDWFACVMARMRGWEVEAFRDLHVLHHKPTLTGEGVLNGAYRQGLMDYSLGSSLPFEAFRCLARARAPYGVAYAACRFAGFVRGLAIRERRPVSSEFMEFLRQEEHAKLARFVRHPFSPVPDS